MNTRNIRILPYKIGSQGASDLATRLGCKQLRPGPESTFVGGDKDIVINWGNSQHIPACKRGQQYNILNPQNRISQAANKLTALQILHNNGVSVPKFVTTSKGAIKMLEDGETKRIFCRTTLTGSGGEGIIIARKPSELVGCQLYVEGIPKAEEYRIHVLRGKILDAQQKRAKSGAKESETWNAEIRNLQFGWVFTREGVNPPESVKKEAIKAVAALGLDFGAVDIAIHKQTKKPFVFEVNTAPGLEGTTLENYANGFQELIEGLQSNPDWN